MTNLNILHAYISRFCTVLSTTECEGDNPDKKDLIVTIDGTEEDELKIKHWLALSTLFESYNRLKIVRE